MRDYKTNPYFGGGFSNRFDILCEFSDYNIPDPKVFRFLKECDLLFAEYDHGGYDGSAFLVIVERYSKGRRNVLYTVEGSHCSCYGLEGQFEPVESNVSALLESDPYGVDKEEWASFKKWLAEHESEFAS